MRYQNMENLLNTKNELNIKIYSLEYKIIKTDKDVIIYATSYEKRKSYYSSFSELMNNYTIYNEPIIDNLDKIMIL